MSASTARMNRSGRDTRQQLDELDALLQRMLDLPVHQDPPAGESEESYVEPPRPARPPATPPPATKRGYPPSYMVVETSTPPFVEKDEPPTHPGLGPRQIEDPRDALFETPTPGGKHDFGAPSDDPMGDLARLRARLENKEGDWVPLRSSWQPSAQTWKPLAETWQQSQPIPEPPQTSPPTWSPPREDRPATSEVPPEPAAHSVEGRSEPSYPAALLPVVWFNKTFDVFLYPLGPVGGWLKRPSGRGFLGTLGLLCLLAAAALAAVTWGGIEGLAWSR